MDFDDYQIGTEDTNVYSAAIGELLAPLYELASTEAALQALDHVSRILNISYVILGYAGEVGEIANEFKKIVRGDGISVAFVSEDEQGDALFYAAQLAAQTGYKFSYIAKRNNQKLQDRKRRGVIKGSGDNR